MRASHSRFIVSRALPAHRQRKSHKRLRSALIAQKVPSWTIIFPLSGLGVNTEKARHFVARCNGRTRFRLAALQARLLSDVAGGRHQGDVPGQQKDGQPSEDPHHLQQRQRLEVAAGPQQRPEGQQCALHAGECVQKQL